MNEEEKFDCPECNGMFTTKQNLERHAVVHTGEKQFECACGKMFGWKASMSQCMKSHTFVKELECGKSDWRHGNCQAVILGELQHTCPCGMKFQFKHDLSTHMQAHSRDNLRVVPKHECSICGRCFMRDFELMTHMKAHNRQKDSFPCTKCGRKFESYISLDLHLEICDHLHVPNKCLQCGKVFLHKMVLNAHVVAHHMTVHTGVNSFHFKPFSSSNPELQQPTITCPKCGKQLSGARDLHKHMNKKISCENVEFIDVTGAKKYKCATCGRIFNCYGNLWKHIHKRKAPCGKKNTNISQTNQISKGLKTNEKEFEGDEIVGQQGKANVQIPPNNEKPMLKCLVCGDEPGFKSSLVDRFRLQNMGMRYICPKCDKNLESEDNLDEYFRKSVILMHKF